MLVESLRFVFYAGKTSLLKPTRTLDLFFHLIAKLFSSRFDF